MMEKILKEICEARSARIAAKGISFGRNIPAERKVPLVKPDLKALLIAEIKRSSPSAGVIGKIDDPVALASKYVANGAGMISVLTEEDRFGGSLDDLIAVKEAHPETAVLRKDFIQHEDEIDVSFRAGADAVLVITAMFKDGPDDFARMEKIYRRALQYGLLPLVEVHDETELEIALRLCPELIGINSRNLSTFVIDKNYPLALITKAPNQKFIFESGIESYYDAFVAGASGFSGVLVGTSIVKSGDSAAKCAQIKNGIVDGSKRKNYFFRNLFAGEFFENRLTVKICGITNVEDALLAESLGADIAGFVAAESVRKIDSSRIREISARIKIPKVAVLTEPDENIFNLAREGVIDAVQLHGDLFVETNYLDANFLWYRCVNISDVRDFPESCAARMLLLDSKSEAKGGSGIRIEDDVLYSIAEKYGKRLRIAGGINAENAAEVAEKFHTQMIDISSGVEEFAGKKSREKMQKLFSSLERYRRGL